MDNTLKAYELNDGLGTTAFAFRGYNVTNLGRSAELVAHRAYGRVVERYLREASEICSEVLGKKVDLPSRVRCHQESTLETFGADIGLIISLELAQIELLEQFFGVSYADARLGLGYSLGEVTALVCGCVFNMRDVLAPLVTFAGDCAELARDVTMGIVFSRGPALDLDAVLRLCLEINSQGRGVISLASHLSPNTVLVLGQGNTVDRFKDKVAQICEGQVHVRKNTGLWPPLHTPLLWQRNVPNRAGVMMYASSGGFRAPSPPVLSLVTGEVSYNDYNSRDLLIRWLDHPQRLWDAVYEMLAGGIETVIHVGPSPNLIPATFKRLSDNVTAQLHGRSLNSLGLRAMSGIVSRPWLAKLLSARAALLRVPFVAQVILEDWLLAQDVA